MKKLMMMAWTAAAVGLFAAPAKQSLVATAELAPFADITPAVTALGTMMNNPLLPAIAIGGAQQALVQSFGRLRASSPLSLQIYLADDAVKDLNLEAKDPFKDKGDAVLVYPIDETEEAFLQKRNAKKESDGTIHLPKTESRPQENWVKFSADGKFCAYAQSPALAARALEDFAKRRPPKAGYKSHLFRINVREAGLAAILAVVQQAQDKQQQAMLAADSKEYRQFAEKLAAFTKTRNETQLKILRSFAGASLSLDLDDYGISIGGSLRRKPGVNASEAGVTLPAGALDMIPDGANLFGACNRLARMAGECTDAADYAKLQKTLIDLLQGVSAMAATEAAKNKELKKYEGLIKEVLAAAGELLGATAYPQKEDWDSLALGFDAQKHPAIAGGGQVAAGAAEKVAACKFLDRLLGAFQRQWPSQKFFVKRAEGAYAIDWAALIDFLVAESKTEQKPEDVKLAKKYISDILGGLSTELVFSPDGQKATLAAPGVKFAASKTGEARFAAAIPEVAKERPAGVFYCTPYAFARDVLLPMLVNFTDKPEEKQQYQAMQAALPPSSSKGALAGASWVRKDGSMRFLLRLTADEVKSIGGAVGALGNASEDDDDDEN